MRKYCLALIALLILTSHDLYLKMDSYFLEPNQRAVISLFNGTFEKSENTIDRSRMLDVSLLGNGNRQQISDDQWTERDSITILNFTSGEAGTWVAGVSTAPRNIELAAEDFNEYLEHDGVKDMLQWRKDNDALDEAAVEKYAKHVKAIFQVGETMTEDWKTELGYPIEFVPMSNPYALNTGDQITVKLLLGGEPLANQLVYADYKPSIHGHTHGESEENHSHDDSKSSHSHDEGDSSHSHDEGESSHSHDEGDSSHSHNEGESSHSHDDETQPVNNDHEHSEENSAEGHQHTSGQELRTNDDGIVSVKLSNDGLWYLRTIHMVQNQEEGITHQSNWATLTFEVRHGHENGDAEDHVHEEDGGIPSYVFWIASIILIVGLFLWFNRKK